MEQAPIAAGSLEASVGRLKLTLERPNEARPINCDQVAWMLAAIERYLPRLNHPQVSRAREMQTYSLLYELMEVAHLHFEDEAAQCNGTPPDVMRFRCAPKVAEAAGTPGRHDHTQGNNDGEGADAASSRTLPLD